MIRKTGSLYSVAVTAAGAAGDAARDVKGNIIGLAVKNTANFCVLKNKMISAIIDI